MPKPAATGTRRPYGGSTRSLVIALDVGTTFSGVSYAILEPGEVPKIHGVTRFPGQEHVAGNSKIPSVLWYSPSGRMRAAGAEAEASSVLSQAEDDAWTRVELFKLRLRPKSTPAPEMNGMFLPKLPRGKSTTHVFGDFLGYLFRCTAQFIRDTHANGTQLWNNVAQNGNIDFVLSHPNSWEGAQQTKMRRAAVHGGLIPDTNEGRARIKFVTEGEASLHACVLSGLAADVLANPTGLGQGWVVADAGGGTLDISSYAVKSTHPLVVEEIAPPDCTFSGSIFVSKRARQFLSNKLANSKYGTDTALDHIAKKFDETTKRLFRDKSEPQYIPFGSPLDKDPTVGIRSGQLKLKGTEVADLFEPSIEAAVNAIKAQIDACGGIIQSVWLVGGFAASPWLFSQLQVRLKPFGVVVSRPDSQTSKAVADGAVGYYCDHFVSARVSRFHYGVEFLRAYDGKDKEHVRRKHRLCELPSGPRLVPDAFDCILARNTKVKESAVFSRKYSTELISLRALATFDVEIWCCRSAKHSKAPAWIMRDSPDFSTLCIVHADLSPLVGSAQPQTGPGGKKYWKIVFYIEISFGLTEFKARLKWVDADQNVKYGPASIVYNERGHRTEEEAGDDSDSGAQTDDGDMYMSSSAAMTPRTKITRSSSSASQPQSSGLHSRSASIPGAAPSDSESRKASIYSGMPSNGSVPSVQRMPEGPPVGAVFPPTQPGHSRSGSDAEAENLTWRKRTPAVSAGSQKLASELSSVWGSYKSPIYAQTPATDYARSKANSLSSSGTRGAPSAIERSGSLEKGKTPPKTPTEPTIPEEQAWPSAPSGSGADERIPGMARTGSHQKSRDVSPHPPAVVEAAITEPPVVESSASVSSGFGWSSGKASKTPSAAGSKGVTSPAEPAKETGSTWGGGSTWGSGKASKNPSANGSKVVTPAAAPEPAKESGTTWGSAKGSKAASKVVTPTEPESTAAKDAGTGWGTGLGGLGAATSAKGSKAASKAATPAGAVTPAAAETSAGDATVNLAALPDTTTSKSPKPAALDLDFGDSDLLSPVTPKGNGDGPSGAEGLQSILETGTSTGKKGKGKDKKGKKSALASPWDTAPGSPKEEEADKSKSGDTWGLGSTNEETPKKDEDTWGSFRDDKKEGKKDAWGSSANDKVNKKNDTWGSFTNDKDDKKNAAWGSSSNNKDDKKNDAWGTSAYDKKEEKKDAWGSSANDKKEEKKNGLGSSGVGWGSFSGDNDKNDDEKDKDDSWGAVSSKKKKDEKKDGWGGGGGGWGGSGSGLFSSSFDNETKEPGATTADAEASKSAEEKPADNANATTEAGEAGEGGGELGDITDLIGGDGGDEKKDEDGDGEEPSGTDKKSSGAATPAGGGANKKKKKKGKK